MIEKIKKEKQPSIFLLKYSLESHHQVPDVLVRFFYFFSNKNISQSISDKKTTLWSITVLSSVLIYFKVSPRACIWCLNRGEEWTEKEKQPKKDELKQELEKSEKKTLKKYFEDKRDKQCQAFNFVS